jgi:hypothetical protein
MRKVRVNTNKNGTLLVVDLGVFHADLQYVYPSREVLDEGAGISIPRLYGAVQSGAVALNSFSPRLSDR